MLIDRRSARESRLPVVQPVVPLSPFFVECTLSPFFLPARSYDLYNVAFRSRLGFSQVEFFLAHDAIEDTVLDALYQQATVQDVLA